MRAMVVEVGPEIEQLVFEIRRRPEQDNSEAGTNLPYSSSSARYPGTTFP
jgi:hypothetical protein